MSQRRVLRITALLLLAALGLPGGAVAAKRKPLTQLEKELRGWLWQRRAITRVNVARQADVANPAEVRTQSGTVSLVTLNTDVHLSGSVTYNGRTLFGIKFDLDGRRLRMFAPAGTEVEITSFALKENRIAVQVKNPRGLERGNVRLFLGDGFQQRMDAGEIVSELRRALDFGSGVDTLIEVSTSLRRVSGRSVELEGLFADASRDVDQRIDDGQRLEDVLEERLRLQGRYDALTNTASTERSTLMDRRNQVNAELARLKGLRLGIKQQEIGVAVQAIEQRLLAADAEFRDSDSDPAGRMALASEIVDVLSELVAECDEYQELGGDELEAEGRVRLALEQFSDWLGRSQAALGKGCLRDEGLSVEEVEQLLEVPVPDATLEREIRRCGTAFEPDESLVAALVSKGLGDGSRSVILSDTTSRTGRADLPELSETLAAALAALEDTASAPSQGTSRALAEPTYYYDPRTRLHWTEPGPGQLDHFDAERYCAALVGQPGWRLPTVDEMKGYAFGPGRGRLSGQVLWTSEVLGSKAVTFDMSSYKTQKARRKFSLRGSVCVRRAVAARSNR